MSRKRYTPEEIFARLRQVEVITARGGSVADAVKSIGVTEVRYYRWRKEFGGLRTDQVKRIKELEMENLRLRKAASDLTLDKLILREAASGTFQAPLVAESASSTYSRSWIFRSVARARRLDIIARRSAGRRTRPTMKRG